MPFSGHLFSTDLCCSMSLKDGQPSMGHTLGIGNMYYIVCIFNGLTFRYFSQGAPVVLFSLYPSFLLGGLQVGNHESLYFVSLWYIVIHRLVIDTHHLYCDVIVTVVYYNTKSSDLYFQSFHLLVFMLVSLHILLCFSKISSPIPGYYLHTVWTKYKHNGNIQSSVLNYMQCYCSVQVCSCADVDQ